MENTMISPDNNAMTEVALALAMAFFAIFILAAVSMSKPNMDAMLNAKQNKAANQEIVHDLEIQNSTKGDRQLKADETFLIYKAGNFYTSELKKIVLEELDESVSIVVGVLPSLSLGEMNRIKTSKKLPNLAITLLDEKWQQRLEQL